MVGTSNAWWHGSVGRTNWSKCPTELVGREYETWWHGSVGRAHRSHRWGRWFESNCHHHLEALVDQGLPPFLPFGITAEGFTFFKVHLGDVNSSGHHSVHTVVWLSCRKIGVALLVESGKKASPKRCSGDALNLNYFRFSCSSRDRQTGRCHSAVTIIYA